MNRFPLVLAAGALAIACSGPDASTQGAQGGPAGHDASGSGGSAGSTGTAGSRGDSGAGGAEGRAEVDAAPGDAAERTDAAALYTPACDDTMASSASVIISTRVPADFALTTDPDGPAWKGVVGVGSDKNTSGMTLVGHCTEVRSRWTPQNLYLLFISQYQDLYLKPNPTTTAETPRLFDWDVVEAFIGSDFANIKRYKEFELSPQGEWLDFAIDGSARPRLVDMSWNSGYEVKARLDSAGQLWYAEMRIPMQAIEVPTPAAGSELRINFYRKEGPPPKTLYLNWRTVNTQTFHTPEAFGRLRLAD